ncbi:hypothetical protein [Sporosarcina sp. USHLN248]|uniref:hypothetical protein n=1 Tax=Sporosarcina sp. USHLN248 TaxID=3081300 RepID=UPI0030161462
MEIAIQPAVQQIMKWVDTYIPERDLFFLAENDLPFYQDYLSGILLFPSKEFFNHSSYSNIEMVNSYMYWTISKDAQFVIVAPPSWIESLPSVKKEMLFKRQHELGRGLLGSLSMVSDKNSIPQDYIVEVNDEQIVALQKAMWTNLPYSTKEEIVCKTAREYDEWTAEQAPANLPSHLVAYANSFATLHGANCLAAVLYAISSEPARDEWIIKEWVHDQTFALTLQQADYNMTDGPFQETDVIVWIDEQDIIQHAAYCIDGKHFFNKNGQTCFNPWKIVDWANLSNEWNRFTHRIYRKEQKTSVKYQHYSVSGNNI